MVETDSKFVANCVDVYLPFWRKNGYVKRNGEPVKNKMYVEELDRLLSQIEVSVFFRNPPDFRPKLCSNGIKPASPTT